MAFCLLFQKKFKSEERKNNGLIERVLRKHLSFLAQLSLRLIGEL